MPTELAQLVSIYQSAEKSSLPTKTSVSTADQDWDKVHDTSSPAPSAPVYAARLNGLMRSLAAAEGAVADSVNARKKLVGELEKLLKSNSEALAEDEGRLATLSSRKSETEEKRREVELAIMRTLPSQESGGPLREGPSQSPGPEPERPEVEELTPPPDAQEIEPESPNLQEPSASKSPPQGTADASALNESESEQQTQATGIEMLSNLASQYHSMPVTTNGSNKRRRVDADEMADLGADDEIDADVKAMLHQESNGT